MVTPGSSGEETGYSRIVQNRMEDIDGDKRDASIMKHSK